MLPSLREDYLEAILLHVNKKGTPPSLHDIAQALNRTYGDVSLDIKELAQAGDITLNADETIALTTAGEETGRQVIKKQDRKSTRLNSSHLKLSRMPSSA